MGTDTHIRVTEDVKERIDRQRREDESFNDALNRILDDRAETQREQFMRGFGAGADTNRPEKTREVHERGERKERARWRARAEGYPVTHRPDDAATDTTTSATSHPTVQPRATADRPVDDADEDDDDDAATDTTTSAASHPTSQPRASGSRRVDDADEDDDEDDA